MRWVLVLCVALLCIGQSFALSCAALEPKERIENADVIFSGRFSALDRGDPAYVSFEDVVAFKGDLPTSIMVNYSLAEWGMPFTEDGYGTEYLVFAYRDGNGAITTGPCEFVDAPDSAQAQEMLVLLAQDGPDGRADAFWVTALAGAAILLALGIFLAVRRRQP